MHLPYILDKPVVGGSDTHQFMQYGAVYTVLEKPCKNVTELKDCYFKQTILCRNCRRFT